ncbi:MAG: TonB family protein [Pseudomonadota bacterium]
MIRLLSLIVLLLLYLPTAATASEYQPISPWNVHYGEISCDLKRNFNNGSDHALLQISQTFHIGGASFYLVTRPLTKERYWEAPVTITLDETGETHLAKGQFLRNRKENLLIWQVYGFDTAILENLEANATLRVQTEKLPEIALKLTSMEAVNNALLTCRKNLYETFGLDFGEVSSLSRQPQPARSPGRWVNVLDYPLEALRRGLEGTTHFMISVDPQGKPLGCNILRSSGHSVLDEQACAALTARAAFEPALDKNGRPAFGNWVSAVRWELP